MVRLLHISILLIFRVLLVLAGLWLAGVLYLSPALAQPWSLVCAVLFLVVFAISLFCRRFRAISGLATFIFAVAVVALWVSIKPSNDRNWLPDARKIPWAEVSDDEVTIHNIRDFRYRTETDYDLNYYSKTFKLSQISEGDIIASYWAGKSVAHIMVSFGFNSSDYIAFSIETRKEVGEGYSTVNGFFRNYELMYVVADERDLLGLRTTYRVPPEQVYVLRTDIPIEYAKRLFMQYIEAINRLQTEPEFYNTLTTNCTTRILTHTRAYGGRGRYNWKVLLSGYVPDYLYEIGALAPGFSLDELMRLSLINERSKEAGRAPDYSIKIRHGIPKPEPSLSLAR